MCRSIAGLVLISFFAAGQLFAAEATVPAATPPAATAPAPAVEKAVTAVPPAAKRFRIGYTDIMKVAEQSDAGKVAKTHYEAKADRLKTQIETKQKLLEKQKSTLEAKLPTYSPEQRAAKIKEYDKKVDELRKLLQKADKEMKPLQEDLIRELYGKIEKTAREYGAANGFDAIIEKREMLYLGSNVDAEDLTDIMIAELNKKK
jgi:outer membrane protein